MYLSSPILITQASLSAASAAASVYCLLNAAIYLTLRTLDVWWSTEDPLFCFQMCHSDTVAELSTTAKKTQFIDVEKYLVFAGLCFVEHHERKAPFHQGLSLKAVSQRIFVEGCMVRHPWNEHH